MLSIDDSYEQLIQREWDHLSRPGTWLDGERRVGVAAAARAARNGETARAPIQAALVEAARRLTVEPATVTVEWIEALAAEGLDGLTYIEVLGICSRLAAVDTFLYGIGQPERPLPTAVAGSPTNAQVPEAELNGGFAPTVGPASPLSALSAIPPGREAMFDLHETFYLSLPEMGQLDIVKDLDRAQLELCAARTSALNECFF